MSGPRERIIGAGLAGLIAAHAWPRAPVLDQAPAPAAAHHALLRFRSEAVSALVGVPFRRVLVRKSVWHDGAHAAATIRTANLYAAKVMGAAVADRSIWDTAAVERWVAPESLYAQLVESVGTRIEWNSEFDFGTLPPASHTKTAIISTAPLPNVALSLGFARDLQFRRAPITVHRFRVPRADLFQSVYFPAAEHSAYRASITGDLLIVEHAGTAAWGEWLLEVARAFGLGDFEPIDVVNQRYGKIAPVDSAARKALLFQMTAEYSVFSLGRFATWRNILLDDVVHDIGVVKSLIAGSSHYDLRRTAARQ